MKNYILCSILLAGLFASGQNHNLKINVAGIHSEQGKIMYSMFSSKHGFPSDASKAVRKGMVLIEGDHVQIQVDLPPGDYAVILFHDEDDNDDLKKNFIGMPKEGVGNSNNHRGFPNYKKSVFTLSKDRTITINLWYS